MDELDYEKIKWNPERGSNIKPCINKCKWKGINWLLKFGGCNMFEKNNPTIACNTFYIKE